MRQTSNQLYEGVPEVLALIRGAGKFSTLRQLQSPSAFKSIGAFLSDWIVIAIAVKIATIRLFPLGLISLVLVGSRQRALSNLVHDASHGNLFASRGINDWVANWLAAFAMLDTVDAYRASHLDHHRYLGTENDPDLKSHLRYGYDDRNPPANSHFSVFLSLLANPRALRDSITGGLFALSANEKIKIATWWGIMSACVGMVFGINYAVCLVGLWMVSRATAYHAIRVFAEFLDHTGLPTGAIFGFTRNLPHSGILARLFHPHEDTYHLIHHLLPKVPHYHLKNAHALLSLTPRYANSHHCDSYFLGTHSAVQCWTGRCKGGSL